MAQHPSAHPSPHPAQAALQVKPPSGPAPTVSYKTVRAQSELGLWPVGPTKMKTVKLGNLFVNVPVDG
jgi:hypothetical protein